MFADSMNPYQPSPLEHRIAPVSHGSSEHIWDDRLFVVRAKALPNFMWLAIAYYVTIDNNETFTSMKLRVREHFEFKFTHQDVETVGRFERRGVRDGGYSLFADGQLIGSGRAPVKGWWCNWIASGMIGALIVAISSLITWALN